MRQSATDNGAEIFLPATLKYQVQELTRNLPAILNDNNSDLVSKIIKSKLDDARAGLELATIDCKKQCWQK